MKVKLIDFYDFIELLVKKMESEKIPFLRMPLKKQYSLKEIGYYMNKWQKENNYEEKIDCTFSYLKGRLDQGVLIKEKDAALFSQILGVNKDKFFVAEKNPTGRGFVGSKKKQIESTFDTDAYFKFLGSKNKWKAVGAYK